MGCGRFSFVITLCRFCWLFWPFFPTADETANPLSTLISCWPWSTDSTLGSGSASDMGDSSSSGNSSAEAFWWLSPKFSNYRKTIPCYNSTFYCSIVGFSIGFSAILQRTSTAIIKFHHFNKVKVAECAIPSLVRPSIVSAFDSPHHRMALIGLSVSHINSFSAPFRVRRLGATISYNLRRRTKQKRGRSRL